MSYLQAGVVVSGAGCLSAHSWWISYLFFYIIVFWKPEMFAFHVRSAIYLGHFTYEHWINSCNHSEILNANMWSVGNWITLVFFLPRNRWLNQWSNQSWIYFRIFFTHICILRYYRADFHPQYLSSQSASFKARLSCTVCLCCCKPVGRTARPRGIQPAMAGHIN